MNEIRNAYEHLLKGDLSYITLELKIRVNEIVNDFLQSLTKDYLDDINIILDMSDILYNNTSNDFLLLEDGVYDNLLIAYKNFDPFYKVGAVPIAFKEEEVKDDTLKEKICPVSFGPPREKIEDMFYFDDLTKIADFCREDIMRQPVSFAYNEQLTRTTVNIKHNYPKLVGTLEKCKFVLCSQAEEKGVLNDANVKIFERDFFGSHITRGIINSGRKFYMVAELKYDGVSVEADIENGMVAGARSRGDAVNDIAGDLTRILKGYMFPKAMKIKDRFGMKFEAIITYQNLALYNKLKGKNYKNARTAIISIFGSLDGGNYRDLITLVPLATSMEDVDRLTEIEFMNKYYTTGVTLKYSVLYGDYVSLLYQIKRFVEEAEYMRDYIPFMYDGVVVSYIEPDLIDKLGRVNAINLYSVAIKFNALKKSTIFTGYTFEVGQDGSITPMIHYLPIEFYGAVQTKSSGHSYKRFNELNLAIGDVIDAEFTNDVMTYITKPDNEHNRNNKELPVPFIAECPKCGNKLKLSTSGKTAICDNMNCEGRINARIANMMDKLNIKDFAEASLKKLNITSFVALMNLLPEDAIMVLGDVNGRKIMDRINEIKTKDIKDYEILGALGFDNIGSRKWKLITNKFSITDIMSMDKDYLYAQLINIKGIGKGIAETILEQIGYFEPDLYYICGNMNNIISTKGESTGKSIRFTGFRDKDLMDELICMGYDASDKNVTKTTSLLLIPYDGFTSSKTKSVKENTLIVAVDDFRNNMQHYLNEIENR